MKLKLNELEQTFFDYGGNRALEAHAVWLRRQIKQWREQELGQCTEPYRKQCAAERRHYQRVLGDFNTWRRERAKKAKR